MTSTSPARIIDLMDDFAINAMALLVHIYAPVSVNDKEKTVQWCESVARISYVMAVAMLETRTAFHKSMAEDFQGKTTDEA